MEDNRSSEEQQGDTATKGDIRRLESRMATKDDLARVEKNIRTDMSAEFERFEKNIRADMATKEGLARAEKNIRSDMATKDDLARTEKNIRADMATKEGLARAEKNIRSDMATQNYVGQVENRLTSQLNQLRDDIGPIKDSHAMGAAIREVDLIAEEMGFEFGRILERKDIRRLVNGKTLLGASSDDLKSFRRADLIMEVTDSLGEMAYVAAEISFTADERDTNRAIRNAEYMSRLTGKQAKAAIVGLRRDNRIERIPRNEVFWYGLPQSSIHSD